MSIENNFYKTKKESENPRSLNIKKGSTPTLPTNPGGEFYKEAHKYHEFASINENSIETRLKILDHYNIPHDETIDDEEIVPIGGLIINGNSISIPAPEKGIKRNLRAFTILINKKNPELIFYADGHCPHAVLLNKIFSQFSKQVGYKDVNYAILSDNWDEEWETKKGFIDPHANGFKDFPDFREALASEMIKKQDNGLSEEQIESFKNNPNNLSLSLPNWFRSG